jgi:peptidyl-prolyl cis-trans isomerase B (cyclophilin B)
VASTVPIDDLNLLSFCVLRDDVVGMRSTLSQPATDLIDGIDQEERSRSAHRMILGSLALLVVVLLGAGCEDSKSGGESSAAASNSSEDGGHAVEGAAYAWPEDPNHPVVRIEVDGAAGPGAIEIELMPELAPVTVAQIIEWADEGFFDGTTFHRVIEDFMIQGGDPNTRDKTPTNDGQGGPGFRLDDEFSAAPFVRGVVGMGNTGQKNSAGSQFFIMHADAPSLDDNYTVIGRVRSGIEVVDAIVDVEIDKVGRWGPRARPIEDVVMTRVRRVEANLAATTP